VTHWRRTSSGRGRDLAAAAAGDGQVVVAVCCSDAEAAGQRLREELHFAGQNGAAA